MRVNGTLVLSVNSESWMCLYRCLNSLSSIKKRALKTLLEDKIYWFLPLELIALIIDFKLDIMYGSL